MAIFALQTFFHSSATSLPGKILFKISPNFLSEVQKYCKKAVITVTGTNGKTTTAGLLAEILKADKNTIVHNEKGANMLTGIATAIADTIRPLKRTDYFILESDEAYLSKLYDFLSANYLIVTNLFRDQLDRYGELNSTAEKIKSAIDKNKNLKVFLNADDPMLSSLTNYENTLYYGFNKIEYMAEITSGDSPSETANCPICDKALCYDEKHYSHIGKYHCECGYRRPEPEFSADVKIFRDYSEITLQNYTYKIDIAGIYNAYNALAAISLSLSLNVSCNTIQQGLDEYKPAFGRTEKKEINGKKVLTQLIKNPTGATEVLKSVSAYNDNSNLLIIINDNYADGRDVSWLWDTNFEILQNYQGKIVVSGIRAYDMATRLKYAQINMKNVIIEPNTKKALKKALDFTNNQQTLLILPTYTALLEMQKIK